MPANAYPYHEGSSHIRTFTQKITPRELGEQLPREAGVHRSVGNRHASKTHILSPDTFPGASQASEMRTLSTKVRQTRVPSARKSAPPDPGGQKRVPSANKSSKKRTLSPKVPPQTLSCIKNTYPQPKSASKTRTLSPKVSPPKPRRASPREMGERQKRVPLGKKCVKNTYP